MTINFSKIFTMMIIITAAAFAQERDHIALEAVVGKLEYGEGDTVVVGIKASIPRGFHLYGNPLGPGIGKPLQLYVNNAYDKGKLGWNVEWTDAYKSVPKRYNPPIGSWVWAYDGEAFFFVKGILNRDSVDTNKTYGDKITLPYAITIDALICRTSCIPILQSVNFNVPVTTGATNGKYSCTACTFNNAPDWQSRFVRSEPMELRHGKPQTSDWDDDDNDNTAEITGLDLSGLSTLNLNDAATLSNTAKIGANDHVEWNYSPLEEKRREYNLLTAILFALVAGLALNLTPCIFPVLSIRILSFAESAKETHRRAVIRSLAFAGGIVTIFLLLATLAAFAGLSWGQQFQNSGVMIGIIAMIFLFALGMFGFYTMAIPSAISNVGEKAGAGLGGDFLKGAMATIMATPCGGPFLGALLAWALLQKPITIFAIFAVMGTGMALPYVLLSSSKNLMKMLPKPGRWIEDLKYAMGFLLLVFAVNLMKSLDPRLTVTSVGICLSIILAASVNKRFAPFGAETKRRVIVVLTAVLIIAAGTALSFVCLRLNIPYISDEPLTEGLASVRWHEFSPTALKSAHEEDRNVIVNFTASWCTNCKLNAAMVLNTVESKQLYIDKNVLLLTADITTPNPPAQNLLHHLGSRSIPFIAIFPADSPKNPIIMRDLISGDRYRETLRGLP